MTTLVLLSFSESQWNATTGSGILLEKRLFPCRGIILSFIISIVSLTSKCLSVSPGTMLSFLSQSVRGRVLTSCTVVSKYFNSIAPHRCHVDTKETWLLGSKRLFRVIRIRFHPGAKVYPSAQISAGYPGGQILAPDLQHPFLNLVIACIICMYLTSTQ